VFEGFGCATQLELNPMPIDLMEGQSMVFVLDTDDTEPGTFVLNILDHCDASDEYCDSFGPSEPPVGGPDGGVDSGEPEQLECMANALARGDTLCAGVECACMHCAQDYDDCGVVPGCAAVRECMLEKACIGTDCYNSGACRAPIDSYGGVSGPAFRAASGLQSCALSFDCALPCGGDAGGPPGGGPDAGQLCEPGRTVACECDGGSGERVCNDEGSAYAPCSCNLDENDGLDGDGSDDDGCGCRVGRSASSSAAWSLGVALLGFSALRRTRRAARKELS
jgi:MYXO-CTERM domain-containing protein